MIRAQADPKKRLHQAGEGWRVHRLHRHPGRRGEAAGAGGVRGIYLEEHKKEYANFILTGSAGEEK